MSARKPFVRQYSHNSTFCPGSASKRATSTPKSLQTQADPLNATTMRIKPSISLQPTENRDLEFDFLYNDYLQSILRHQLITDNIRGQKEDLEGQLAYRMDSLHQTTQSCHVLKQKIEQLDSIKNVGILVDSMDEIINHFQEYCKCFDLENELEQFSNVLESENKKIYLKNVKPIGENEYNKLSELIELCSALSKNFSNVKDIEQVGKVADGIRKMKELESSIKEKHKEFVEAEGKLGLLCLKQMSDQFAQKRLVEQ